MPSLRDGIMAALVHERGVLRIAVNEGRVMSHQRRARLSIGNISRRCLALLRYRLLAVDAACMLLALMRAQLDIAGFRR